MIDGHGIASSPQQVSRDFAEWASLFSEGLFVMLQVYGDESGTNDISGIEPGSSVPTVCGYINSPEYWKMFCKKWKRALDKFQAQHFHFREFASKHLCSKENSPYFNWGDGKRDAFLYELATLASESSVPVGGFCGARGNLENPFEIAATKFFEDLALIINRHWPNYRGKILCVFDRCGNETWISSLWKAYAAFTKRDMRLGGLTFEDDKDPKHLPLQAADLLAYATRQQTERVAKTESLEISFRVLDFILNRNRDLTMRQIPAPRWRRIVRAMHQDQRKQKAAWIKDGPPKQNYDILTHFRFEKYANELKSRPADSISKIQRFHRTNRGRSQIRD